ncbi:MAG: Crp/Fnr family transcriptional regulator [Methylococcaceae bacterium]|nr:Crp/Fnr family transcriptional regulator [Methylococcaceae bacterium]
MLVKLAERAKPIKFQKQSTIIMEGDTTSSLYIILSGKVRIFGSDDKSKELTLMIQEAGSYFGEIALLSDEPRSASVVALENTTCAVISKTDFINWLMQHPEVAIMLLGVLSNKIRQLTEKAKQMALSNVYERIIIALQEMAEVDGEVRVIHNKPSQEDLAKMIGSSREMVNKVMQELIKGGYVTIREKDLIINKKLPASW